MTLNRRNWIRQSGLALAGLTLLSNRLPAAPPRHYAPGDPLRLFANENPYGPPQAARKAMADAIARSNRYPWDMTTQLREQIAATYGLQKENVLMGAGSSEMLGLVAQYAALQQGNAVSADPVFRIWWSTAEKLGLTINKIPLTAGKVHNLDAMRRAVNAQTRLVYVCNPNNPTGTIVDTTVLKEFIKDVSTRALVLLDEAYIEYSNQPTLASLVRNNKNLIVVKTFSKIYGMAGARIGYALAHPDTIDALGALQPWENAGVSAVSAAGALAALQDKDFLALSVAKRDEGRTIITDAFRSLDIPFIPTNSNFMYYSAASFNGDLPRAYNAAKIMTGGVVEEEGRWMRITIGTPEEMKAVAAFLKQNWKS
jgi:histidinol-phosphate aminotransferase